MRRIQDYVIGQETEYALRYQPEAGAERPSNFEFFRALRVGMRKLTAIKLGSREAWKSQFFTENGGAFSYEHHEFATRDGLMEGATPECSSASELLLYQKAQESLLLRALPLARKFLREYGMRGDLALVKNCRDHLGNVYGAQENYETEPLSGFALFFHRVLLFLHLPVYYFSGIFVFVCRIVLRLSLLIAALVLTLLKMWIAFLGRYFPKRDARGEILEQARKLQILRDDVLYLGSERERFVALIYKTILPAWSFLNLPVRLSLRYLVFRRQRKFLTAFLTSRVIITGAGTLLPDGSFVLGEKMHSIKSLGRATLDPAERPFFDNGNLHKDLAIHGREIRFFRRDALVGYFASPRRLQLGASDSNRSQFAEYLKFGTTLLVLRAGEAGYLRKAPRFREPLRAIQTINADVSLKARVGVKGREKTTALEIQRFYVEAVRRYLDAAESAPMEYHEILREWESTLDALEKEPTELLGRLDWVTKRYLLETAGAGASFSVKKKIDIAYHELGTGYFDKLEAAGLAPRLVEPKAVEQAVYNPPSPETARIRARFIKEEFPEKSRTISWNAVELLSGGKIVSLDQFRKTRPKNSDAT